MGEGAIRASGAAYVILRCSWVYSAFGSNFVKTILRVGAEKGTLRIVSDQYGSPTAASDIASTILGIAGRLSNAPESQLFDTFHYCGAGVVSWCEFGEAIIAASDVEATISPIKSADYVSAVRRPENSALDCGKIGRIYGIARRPWRDSLHQVLLELNKLGKGIR